MGDPSQNNYVIHEQPHIEDAFNEKESQLFRETQLRMQLQQELIQERHQREKFQKKLSLAEIRLKKFNTVNSENERKRKLLNEKMSELSKLRDEVEQLREKAKERDAVNNKNKELITKYYGQSSAVAERDKRIQELKDAN
jgi:chromosome segregation ATPase